MARYTTTIPSGRPAPETFDYLAEFSNAQEWDPGVSEANPVPGSPEGVGRRFHLVNRFLGRSVPLDYEITDYQRPHQVVLRAESSTVTSVDTITVRSVEGGTELQYDADLRLKGLLAVFDPLLRLAFNRMGDRAAAGLRRALRS